MKAKLIRVPGRRAGRLATPRIIRSIAGTGQPVLPGANTRRSRRYASASEVVRDALRLLEEQEKLRALKLQELRQLIQDGIDSGPGRPAKQVLAELRERIDAIAQQRLAD